MSIGLGIVLVLLGLILVLNVVHLPASVTNVVDAHTLGWILLIIGILALLLSLIVNAQRGRTHTRVEERRVDDV